MNPLSEQKLFVTLGAVLGGFGVLIGAFGAHGLQSVLSSQEMEIYKLGVNYHFIHALALIGYGHTSKAPSWPGWAFLVGILLFSGSLYGIAMLHLPILGMITPIGGVLFILGWGGWALRR